MDNHNASADTLFHDLGLTQETAQNFKSKGFYRIHDPMNFRGELPYALHFLGYDKTLVGQVLLGLFGPETQPVLIGRYYLHPESMIYFRNESDLSMFLLRMA